MTRHPTSSSTGSARTLLFAIIAIGTACGDHDSGEDLAETDQTAINQCVRNEAVLRSAEPASCDTDANCPCGSFCDPIDHRCTFSCMVPPANADESCPTGSQCDDDGRCVVPGATPAPQGPVLAVDPPVLRVAPSGGPPQQLAVGLSVFTTSTAAVLAAQSTVVRVAASDGIEVSCNATTFGRECQLTGWTFSWNGTSHLATRSFWARTVASNSGGNGDVTLRVDATDAEIVVPASSSASSLLEGSYAGVATSAAVPAGIPVDVRVRGGFVVVRDPSQIIAPDGALLLDLVTQPTQTPTARRTVWLRSTGTGPTGPTTSLVGEYIASGPIAFDAATGALTAGFQITLPGPQSGPTTDAWTLRLQRIADHEAECVGSGDCAAGSECAPSLNVCVPTAVWTPPTAAVANELEDVRSSTWWNAIVGRLGTSDTTPAGSAFATTGGDLIETLMCTTADSETDAGRLGVHQVRQFQQPSRSGDLACASSNGSSPGPVGLVTYADRVGSASSSALLGTCLQDLARAPAGFATDFAVGTGQCANLARFVPALRLIAADELGKRTSVNDARTRSLFVRLLQQWSQLHGFVASTGLSEREYDDAIAATPAEARQELVSLLDVIDAGWAALLDRRIAPTVAAAAPWAPTEASSVNDYREAKKPVVYWAFNGGSNPQRDLVRGVDLVQRISSTNADCQILGTRNALVQGWNCPGHRATLPAGAPSIGGNTNLTVSMFVRTASMEFPPYFGGTLFQTETLAAVSEPSDRGFTLALVHPTADGGTEWVGFGWVYGLAGTSIAIVRDTQAMTYTVYVYEAWKPTPTLLVMTQRYQQRVAGVLPGTVANRIALANGYTDWRDGRQQIGQFPRNVGFAGTIDDFAIFNSALSKREFLRIAGARGLAENRRDTYPEPMTLTPHGTQELTTPVGASLLDAQVAHLEVVARLAQHLTYESQAACEGQDATARQSLDEGIARAGHALRQSFVIENLARLDTTERANQARQLLQVKRSTIARALQRLRTCANPYGMTDGEVPLYFGEVAGETGAFFAASDHLLALAEPRAQAAKNALAEFRTRWDQARQSQLQELQSTTARAIRVEETELRYAEQLKRLCGATETTQQIVQQVKDGTFLVDKCFVNQTTSCLAGFTGSPLKDADPTCYRGVIGSQLMEMRAAYHSQQAAYQAWQAAIGNADGAERQCVLDEMDAFGCSALDRHELAGVTCPPNHQGTIELVTEWNRYLSEREEASSWFNAVVTTITTAASVAAAMATGPGAAFVVAAKGALSVLGPEQERAFAARKRNHELVLQKRAVEANLRACWTAADRYQREIAAAEEASKEATARMQSAMINFENAIAQAREVVIEAPIVIQRELTRPSIPIAFHYWLPDEISNYRFLLDSARRYTYMALRATEFDTQETYATPQSGKPSRAAVLAAWRPDALVQQLTLMRDATNSRRTGGRRPSEDHLVLDVAKDIFGLTPNDSLAEHLEANARPVYSTRGEYLGRGVRFTFLPAASSDTPSWRCAERLWRANVAAVGFSGALSVKLLKRTVFGSRRCDDSTYHIGTLRPQTNLLVASGDPQTYVEPSSNTVADIDVVNLNVSSNVDAFHNADDFADGASTELAGQGLYGSYVLLFTAPSLTAGLDVADLEELHVRFDFVSVDNLPSTSRVRPGEARVEKSLAPIIVE